MPLETENKRLARENAALQAAVLQLQQQSFAPSHCQQEQQGSWPNQLSHQGFQHMWWPVQCVSYCQGMPTVQVETKPPSQISQEHPVDQPQEQESQPQRKQKQQQKKQSQPQPAPEPKACEAEFVEPAAEETKDLAVGEDLNDPRTTVMLRNLPNNYTRAMLLKLFESEGFLPSLNFVYLPIDFRTQSALGYAFVDLEDPAAVRKFKEVFEGYTNWSLPSRKASFVSWCGPNQGVKAHIERYRNSPIMHASVPEEHKPVLLERGVRVPFPKATKSIRLPRVRNSSRAHSWSQAAFPELEGKSASSGKENDSVEGEVPE